MAAKINPPSFHKGKSYELYKQELIAWNEITEIDKAKRGIAIALTLPEDDEHRIREKVFDQIKIDDLKKENGFKTLVDFLDKHLAKDDLADSLSKFEEFEDVSRAEGQSISDFISEFDTKYRKIEKKNMKLPPEILAFKLLRKSNLTKDEKMLVLTGMNYEHRETLYDEAKQSLKKFMGDGAHARRGNVNIKLEPAFLAEHEEALLAAGYIKRENNNYRRGGWRGRGRGSGFQSSQRGVKNLNPSGPDGNVLTCRSCGSYRHLVAKCPDSWENMAKVNTTETEEHAVLFTGYHKEEVLRLGADARNCAVLDSACSSTVCGKLWLDTYLDSLPEDERRNVIVNEGIKVFKFGGGTRLRSNGEYNLPMCIAGKDVKVKTDVVESDIPLLLSRSAMKKASIKMDLENDTAEIFGKTVNLNITSSGHYCIPIDKTETLPVEEVSIVNMEKHDKMQQKSILLKLHRQFAHPPKRKLIALLKDAGSWKECYDEDLMQIESSCDICKTYARTPPKPVVALPSAKEFNEKVAMDLKQYNGRWILHMIDMWSRYTVSVFIKRKESKDVINAIMKNWVGVFGIMGAIMTDNGGEFNSDEMREIASILNVKIHTTAAYSPFQNGLCERVHSITDSMLMKLEADNEKVDIETLLSWANMARNSLQMWNGFSSNQLIFGRNPNLPNIVQAQPPALEDTTTSEAFSKHLNALHETRKAYMQTEADERIRRALRSKVRAAEQVFVNGDNVFYKREGRDRWLGPGKVVFQDGKVVFVRHGGVFVRVSPNRLCKVDQSNMSNAEQDESEVESQMETNLSLVSNSSRAEISTKSKTLSETIGTKSKEDENENIHSHDKIEYKMPDSLHWTKATVIGRAGKATGKYKMWFNVEDDITKVQKSVDLGSVEWRKIDSEAQEDVNSAALCNSKVKNEIYEAKQSELQKLYEFNTYEIVKDCGQKTISTRWVITNKEESVRARLVARGFEEKTFIPKDSPTVRKGSIRVFLAVASSKCWKIKTTDIKSAFLQGNELERDVYILPPVESETPDGYIWKLKHGLYGLKDGARQFYMSVKDELLELGFTQSKLDPAVFTLVKDKTLQGIICCHVDDFLHAGNKVFDTMLDKLRGRFLAGKVEEEKFNYIGFQIRECENGIIFDHNAYIDKLVCPKMDPVRASEKGSLLTESEQSIFRKLVGQLNWVVQGSRPDMAFELVDLSTKLTKASVSDLLHAIKAVGKLRDMLSIHLFPHLYGNPNTDWEIFVFCDASLGNLNDKKGSTGAHILWIKDRLGNCCPVFWQSNKIRRVVRSTIAAEALSLGEALESAIYYRELIQDVGFVGKDCLPITVFTDNKSVIDALRTTRLVDDKRLRIDIAAIQEMRQNNHIEIKWCPGKIQLANSLTKRGASSIELLSVLQKGKMPEEFV